MAQRVDVVLIDDIDGSDADETVAFAIDGVEYEIDLSADNAGQLREVFETYVAQARRAASTRRRRSSARATVAGNGVPAAEIRAWARENGWDVPGRGRVSAELREAYEAAH